MKPRNHMTMWILLDLFLEYLENKDCSPHTIRHYRSTMSDFICFIEEEFLNGIALLEDITFEHLQAYLSYKKKQGNCGVTRKNIITTFRSFWRFLCKRGYSTDNPSLLLDEIHTPKKERVYLTIDEMQQFLSCIDHPTIYTACTTICFTGLRISELCQLQLEDVNFSRNQIFVQCGKGKKDRTIPIHPQLQPILMDYYNQHRAANSHLFFATPSSGKLSTQYLNEKIHFYAKKAGVNPNISAHCLRHTFASALVAKGASLPSIQRLLGHSNLKTTNVYVHINNKDLEQSVNLLNL